MAHPQEEHDRKRSASTDLDLSRPSTIEEPPVLLSKKAKLAEQHAILLDSDTNEAWQQLNDLEKVSVNAGKALEEFRNYEDSARQSIVSLHYQKMREHQTVAKVDYFYNKYHNFTTCEMTIWEAFEAYNG